MQYKYIAQRLIRGCYGLEATEAITVGQMLELIGTESDMDQVLVENDAKRIRKLDLLVVAIRLELSEQDRRRIRAPITESLIAPGSFTLTFADDPSLEPGEREVQKKFRQVPQTMDAMRALSPKNFEILCGSLMTSAGCTRVIVTQAQGDDGVDFLGHLPFSSIAPLPSSITMPAIRRLIGGLSFLIYGQAKRYAEDNKVGQEEVFELEGSWRSTFNAYFDNTLDNERGNALREIGYRTAVPVLLVLMTTSSFTAGALSKADALGMILLDGEQVAQLAIEVGADLEAIALAPSTWLALSMPRSAAAADAGGRY